MENLKISIFSYSYTDNPSCCCTTTYCRLWRHFKTTV